MQVNSEFFQPHLALEDRYKQIVSHINAIVSDERDLDANLGNIAALLNQAFRFHWVGFYKVKGDELVLGPFQGPPACVRIKHGRGVCGSSWAQNRTIVVPDVHEFPGHIACSEKSNSEIVVPIQNAQGVVVMVLDVDSEIKGELDELHSAGLRLVAEIVKVCWQNSLICD